MRKTHSAENERIKRQYFTFLREAKKYSTPTVDAVAKAIDRFEQYGNHRDFRQFHIQQAIAFKAHLAASRAAQSGRELSKATVHATLGHLKAFFHWLAGQAGFKSRLQYSDSEYFNMNEKDARIATASRERAGPTLEQIENVLGRMGVETEVLRRNRAVVAFTILTGARDGALASLKLKHVDLAVGRVDHDAKEVNTKFSKSYVTYFFPVPGDARVIVEDWIRFLREEKLWGEGDPLFPATHVALGATRQFEVVGLKRAHWTNSTAVRGIFKKAFNAANLPYFNPHSFRKTLAQLGEKLCRTPEEFKAWSQNLGHEGVLTTFCSYGSVSGRRQAELLNQLGFPSPLERCSDVRELARMVAHELRAHEAARKVEI
jgi:integrase/recombinase XerD